MTNKKMYEAYKSERNPAMRDWYAKTMNDRANTGSSEAREYVAKMHKINKAGK